MGIFTRSGCITPSASPPSRPRSPQVSDKLPPMLQRCGYAAALIIGLAALLFIPLDRNAEDVARLERLAPGIERARALPSETRDSINRLVARQSLLLGTSGQLQEMRRKAAIDRVTSAMRAKESSSTGRSIADAAIQ